MLPKPNLRSGGVRCKVCFHPRSRLEKVVFDILDDFYKKDRLASGRGNAMLVASSIYEACQYYEIFQAQGFTKCAVVTSYEPGP